MRKIGNFVLILIIGTFVLSACNSSAAQKEIDKKVTPPASTVKSNTQSPPEENPSEKENSNKLSAEQIKNGSVKSDDYQDNMKNDKKLCDVEAFVTDEDPKGLNVRADGNIKAKIIGQIPFDDEGVIVHIAGANFNGWMIIDRAVNMEGKTVFKGKGWVAANMLSTSTAGYGSNGVKLYESDGSAKILTTIPAEEVVKISACNQKYVEVKYKTFTGWLEPESQCANPMTNCS